MKAGAFGRLSDPWGNVGRGIRPICSKRSVISACARRPRRVKTMPFGGRVSSTIKSASRWLVAPVIDLWEPIGSIWTYGTTGWRVALLVSAVPMVVSLVLPVEVEGDCSPVQWTNLLSPISTIVITAPLLAVIISWRVGRFLTESWGHRKLGSGLERSHFMADERWQPSSPNACGTWLTRSLPTARNA